MSGKPNEDGARRVVALLDEAAGLSRTLGMVDSEIVRLTAARVAAFDKAMAVRTALAKELEAMDLSATGNWGHEERRAEFLRMLVEAARRP